MKDIFDKFSNISVYQKNGKFFLHKPLLLLIYLGFCWAGRERLILFSEIDQKLIDLFKGFYPEGAVYGNTHYPFGKLENDGIWEIENSATLQRTSVDHLFKTELIERNIRAGFSEEVYENFLANKHLVLDIADLLLERYFAPEQHQSLRAAVGLPSAGYTTTQNTLYGVKQTMGTVSDLAEPALAEADNRVSDGNLHLFDMIAKLKPNNEASDDKDHQNGYIRYLNSLHNLAADGSNALAESQALNPYFAELYVPFPLAKTVKEALTTGDDKVIILTGHAGDGKSTVALDVFKYLHGYALNQPLQHKLKEREVVRSGHREISIVKDMSELSAEERLKWLDDAFGKAGSWLIISNTGPLLNSLSAFVKNHGIADVAWVESEILKRLDTPYKEAELSNHTLRLNDTTKPLVILNMTRLNNVELGARVLEKMLRHSGWAECQGCDAEESCPLRKNRQALQQAHVIERVRWIYQRLTTYEQRLTLRQIVAHLAFSLTGGLNCTEARAYARDTQVNNGNVDEGLAGILFSESFFGYQRGEVAEKTSTFKAIELIRRLEFGSPFAVDFERKLIADDDTPWVDLPAVLTPVVKRWRSYARDPVGVRWRFALRRMAYLYGQAVDNNNKRFDAFIDNFLQSPKLRQFDRWQRNKAFDISYSEQDILKDNILRVLLEFYSGFSARQFESHDSLYLTLRRADRVTIQSVQIVLASLSNEDFSLDYDDRQYLPILSYRDGEAKLMLSLPLLDYIEARSIGNLGGKLTPIHSAQLEWFRSKLLQVSQKKNQANNKIILLKTKIDGTVNIHRFLFSDSNGDIKLRVR